MHLRLALLTYANAALVYALVTYPETGTPLAAARKVAVSLWWLLPLATPFAILFAVAGTPLVRATLARTAHLPTAISGGLATLAFLLPASALVEAALATRDGLSPARVLLQIAGGLTLAALWALLRRR